MNIRTHFYRLKAEAIKGLETNPEKMDLLLGCSETTACCGEKTIYCAAPRLDIEQAWDEILIVLCRTENASACRTLDVPLWEDFDGFEEVRLYAPSQVRDGREFLESLDLSDLRREALRRKLRSFNGEPLEKLIDDVLQHLDNLVAFWREAAGAGEGIVSSTG